MRGGIIIFLMTLFLASNAAAQECVSCHKKVTPNIVSDWQMSEHSRKEVNCSTCHGDQHKSARDVHKVQIPSPETCAECHETQVDQFKGGKHALAWAADRATILQGLDVLDPGGKPTARLEVVKAADVARLTQEDWQKERDKMLKTCNRCHSLNFAKAELEKGDQMIREADHVMAQAIRTVAALYKDGILPKPKSYAYAFPDLLTFHDAPTSIEQKLFVMFLEHRERTFQGTFHANPDYALWYGWSELQRDLREITTLAEELREKHRK